LFRTGAVEVRARVVRLVGAGVARSRLLTLPGAGAVPVTA